MERLELEDPADQSCPVRETHKPSSLVFHGTSDRFASSIEKKGLDPAERPYKTADLESLLEIYETLAFQGAWVTYTALKVRVSTLQGPPRLGFSLTWGQGHDYAIMARAGTTIMVMLNAAQELVALTSDAARRQEYQRALERRLEGDPGTPGDGVRVDLVPERHRDILLHALSQAQDPRYRDHITETTRTVVTRYLGLVQSHRPVVYALRVPPKERHAPRWLPLGSHELQLTERVPPEEIAYRIDLPADAQASFRTEKPEP